MRHVSMLIETKIILNFVYNFTHCMCLTDAEFIEKEEGKSRKKYTGHHFNKSLFSGSLEG